MTPSCEHLKADVRVGPPLPVCSACIETGGAWVHLRQCLTCGRTGCCDQSPNRHATAHFHETGHPVIRSAEPGEAWWWCYVDDILYEPDTEDDATPDGAAS
jgi:uncharacterized UBP type Zn finger protein